MCILYNPHKTRFYVSTSYVSVRENDLLFLRGVTTHVSQR